MSDSGKMEGCLVTGVAGFVGSHLAERLLSLNFRVVGVDNFVSGFRRNMSRFRNHPAFVFHERSINETALLGELKELHPELQYCFHLAAIVSVPYSVDHPDETMEINYHSTVALLDEAEEHGFRAFVFAGSAAEYGDDPRVPLLEEFACETTHHLSPYGRAKFLASRQVASRRHGTALRCFNIYGPRQDPSSAYSGVISRFIDMALKGEGPTVFGDGLQTRDFVYVSDVVEAYVRSAGLGGSAGSVSRGVYNIGTGRSTTILELARTIQGLSGNSMPITFGPERTGDIRHSFAAVEAFRKAAAWNPEVSLSEGLKRTLIWARDGIESD